jgi:hypothetical protein
MTGYVRQDTADLISNGNPVDADLFDQEYDAIQAAFHVATGHTHDGTSAEGGPITKVGPTIAQTTVSATAITPAVTNTVDIGTSAIKFKDGYFAGDVTADSFVGDVTGTITGDVIGNLTGNVTGNVTGDITGNIVSSGPSTFNDITVTGGTLSGITALTVTNPAAVRDGLGLEIGADVQAWDVNLDQIATLTPTNNNVIVGNGASWTSATIPISGYRLKGAVLFTSGSGTYTKPSDVNAIVVEAIGAGGGGGSAKATTTGQAAAGGGGGGGAYARVFIPNPDSSYTYTVGAKGSSSGAAINGSAGDGGDTSFVAPASVYTILAPGGTGGVNRDTIATSWGSAAGGDGGGVGGLSGPIFGTAPVGAVGVGISGEKGVDGIVYETWCMGRPNGGSSFISAGGRGGLTTASTLLSNGQNANHGSFETQATGSGGSGGGGGGGGGVTREISGGDAVGGDGANGAILVWEYY